LERYLRVNLLGPGPRLIKKEFTGPRSRKGSETLVYTTYICLNTFYDVAQRRNSLTTHFSEHIPVLKRRICVLLCYPCMKYFCAGRNAGICFSFI